MAHCNNLVLHCIDFRFIERIGQFMEEEGMMGDCDVVSLNGVAKNIVDPTNATDQEFVLHQIDLSERNHGVKNIYIVNHTDCDAYGNSEGFASKEEEVARHEGDLQKAADLLRAKHPEMNIVQVLAHIDADSTIWFDKCEKMACSLGE